MISITCLCAAGFLFTQPQLVQLASDPPSAKPLFSLDSAFSWPLDVLSYAPAGDLPYDVTVILCHLVAPVMFAFVFVFVFICKDVHPSVVAVWMGVGGGAASIYGETEVQWVIAEAET